MNKAIKFITWVLIMSFFNVNAQNDSFNKIYNRALRGDITTVLTILDTITVSSLKPKEQIIRKKYFERFREEKKLVDNEIEDKSIRSLVNLFQEYWVSVMTNKVDVLEAENILISGIAIIIFEDYYKESGIKKDVLREDIYTYINDYLQKKGFFSNAMGKTATMYDLYLWKDEEKVKYPVRLINEKVLVEVHFMNNFISQGWAHFATFGRSYSGGWTTKEALFCVNDAYDKASEDFYVSYLSHEGQHFSDYKKFPELGQTDLEYRAKLVELVKSKNTTYSLIEKFIQNTADDPKNAHAFANYILLRDLSRPLIDLNLIPDIKEWKKISQKKIKKVSKKLFNQHTRALKIQGSKTIKQLIHI